MQLTTPRRTVWHTWFAWYPVYCENIASWVWLENVLRQQHKEEVFGSDYRSID